MIERYRILAEDTGYAVPTVGSEVTFKTTPVLLGISSTEEIPITVTITAVDPSWGPDFNRIEGFCQEGDDAHTILGFHLIKRTPKRFVGLIEIHRDE